MSTLRCPACSTSLSEGSDTCPACGVNLSSSVPTQPLTGSSAAPGPEFQPGASFAGRYTIVERAGEGGMGSVYKAIDNSLDQVGR